MVRNTGRKPAVRVWALLLGIMLTSTFIVVAPTPAVAADPPNLMRISPLAGSEAGGTTVTLSGSGFDGATAVSFGASHAASYTVVSDNSITSMSPAGTGRVDITVTTPSGTSNITADDEFTYVPAVPSPTVTGLDPGSGPTDGGTSVTITGTNFSHATAVSFGGVSAVGFTDVDDTTITAISPPGTGIADVTVTTPIGTSETTAVDEFTYQVQGAFVDSISPDTGSSDGGTTVTITGTGFAGTTGVSFGTTPATSYIVVSGSTITAISPPGSDVVDVTVFVGAGGASYQNVDDLFYYVQPTAPTISGLSPSSGPTSGDTTVTIAGNDLTGASSVSFGGTPAQSFEVVSDSSITAVAPAHANGSVSVTVLTNGGTSNSQTFTYVVSSLPTKLSLSPSHGPQTGGTAVTLSGSNIAGAKKVTVDGVSVPFTIGGRTPCITFKTPVHASGTVAVVVTTAAGTGSTSFTYDKASVPHINSVNPNKVSSNGSDIVVLRGSNFDHATSTTVDGKSVSFRACGNGCIAFSTFAHKAGNVAVVLTTVAGASNVATLGYYQAQKPHVSKLSPGTVKASGGYIFVDGTDLDGTTSVTVAGVSVWFAQTSGLLEFKAPPHAAGVVNVVVTTPAGAGNVAHLTYSRN